jgi:hypothetical protein
MRVVRYSEKPVLWDSIENLSRRVWPEYNMHGEVLNQYWGRLYDEFADYQFVLCEDDKAEPLAEGNTIPVRWDGADAGLGPGIDAAIAGGFALLDAGGTPTALCALAAKVPPENRQRGLSEMLLRGMAELAADAGLTSLIAPVLDPDAVPRDRRLRVPCWPRTRPHRPRSRRRRVLGAQRVGYPHCEPSGRVSAQHAERRRAVRAWRS